MTTNKVTLAVIDTEIKTFVTNREHLKTLGHNIAMLIFYHAAPKEVGPDCNGTGDCSRAAKLMKELPNSWQPQYRAWLETVSPIRVATDMTNAGYDKKYPKVTSGMSKAEKASTKEEQLTWWKLEEANETPFYLLEEPEAVTTVKIMDFDELVKMVKDVAKRLGKIVADEDNRRVIKPEDKPSAQHMLAVLDGLHFDRVKVAPPRQEDVGTSENSEVEAKALEAA